MKRKPNNHFASYACVAALAYVAGSAGTILMQHCNRYHIDRMWDIGKNGRTDSEQDFASKINMSKPIFASESVMSQPPFPTEGAEPSLDFEETMSDPALAYEEYRSMDMEPGE